MLGFGALAETALAEIPLLIVPAPPPSIIERDLDVHGALTLPQLPRSPAEAFLQGVFPIAVTPRAFRDLDTDGAQVLPQLPQPAPAVSAKGTFAIAVTPETFRELTTNGVFED
jgi:hypothetical protein